MKKFLLLTAVQLTSIVCALSQKVGIGTSSPIARLEVKGEGSNSATNNLVLKNSIGDTLLRVRNDARMTLGYNGFTVGRPLNIGGIGVNFYLTDAIFGGAIFPQDSALVIWSEFGDNKFVILQPQWGKVGIGTYVPKAKLHVSNGVSNATPHSNTVAAFESNTNGYITLLTPVSNESGIFFGNQTSGSHGGILYNSTVANGLAFRTNGNSTKMVIADNGQVGINTIAPNAHLDVNGTINASSEIRRTSTGAANLVPICYGSVSPATPPVIQSGTGNFSVTNPEVGRYEITITGENYTNSGYTAVVTPVSSNFRAVSIGAAGNNLVIRFFNLTFDQIDTYFHFVVFQN